MNGAVAAVLRGERAASGVTLDELSGRTGIPTVSLQRYLKGKRHLDVDIVWTIAGGLELDVSEVFSRAAARYACHQAGHGQDFLVQETAARDEEQ